MRIASAGVHGQLTSSMSATSGPTASRAAATEATSVWWSFTPRNPCATAAAAARATSAGRSNRARLAYAGIRGWTRPPRSSYTGTPRACPARSQSASSTPLIANMPSPRRPNRSVARCSRSTSRSMSVGGSPSRSGAERVVHDRADGRRRAEREGLAPAHEPLIGRDADQHLLPEPRRPRGRRIGRLPGNRRAGRPRRRRSSRATPRRQRRRTGRPTRRGETPRRGQA